jgi:hypothetical protein
MFSLIAALNLPRLEGGRFVEVQSPPPPPPSPPPPPLSPPPESLLLLSELLPLSWELDELSDEPNRPLNQPLPSLRSVSREEL